MTCSHAKGDTNCGRTVGGHAWRENEAAASRSAERSRMDKEIEDRTPNPENFEVVDYVEVEGYLVLKVKYPSCKKCAFDSCKIMVFPECTTRDLMFWKRIDPHFHGEKKSKKSAPMALARFPANSKGWADAQSYAARQGVVLRTLAQD